MKLIELGGDPPTAVIELSPDEARSLGPLLYQDVSVVAVVEAPAMPFLQAVLDHLERRKHTMTESQVDRATRALVAATSRARVEVEAWRARVEAEAANIEQREPYRTALEVLDSPDPEAALARLHPELRDAVRVLIGLTHG